MIYSCGLFVRPDDTLETAQEQKMTRILDQARIESHHHVLEIGCGWGGFAVFAAKKTGCRVTGTYDRIVSIEMIEAVGPQFLGRYFQQCRTLLKPGGTMVFQAITIVDDRYEQYCKERDWIQKHIFPGGHLPCLKILTRTIAENSDFNVADVYEMGSHYATTLAHWHNRFAAHEKEVNAMGFDREFFRKWLYYFSICEAGFKTACINDIQVTLHR